MARVHLREGVSQPPEAHEESPEQERGHAQRADARHAGVAAAEVELREREDEDDEREHHVEVHLPVQAARVLVQEVNHLEDHQLKHGARARERGGEQQLHHRVPDLLATASAGSGAHGGRAQSPTSRLTSKSLKSLR